MVLILKKILKKGWGNDKIIHELNRNLRICVWERKNWQFWNDCNHLKVIKNVNHLLEKNFKKAELESFTLYCRACPKTVEGNKQGRCRTEKKLAKAEIIVNWLGTIEYGLFWLNSHIQGWFSLLDTNSLWFHGFSISCRSCSKSTKSMKPNWNISREWVKVLCFIWENIFYVEVRFSY